MDAATFTREMARLAAAFGHELTDARAAVYLEDLGPIEAATFVAACRRARAECRFFPSIAELLGLVRDLDIAAGRRYDGATAWAQIERRILARFPDYRTSDWPDELASDVFRAELGLPYDVARLDNEYDRSRARERFITAYNRQCRAAEYEPGQRRLDHASGEAGNWRQGKENGIIAVTEYDTPAVLQPPRGVTRKG